MRAQRRRGARPVTIATPTSARTPIYSIMAADEKENANEPSIVTSDENATDSDAVDNVNVVVECVLKNDIGRLLKCITDDADPHHDTITELLSERDENGKSPLEIAATLGRKDFITELITRGVNVNSATETGYSALHMAAAWGQIDSLKMLVELAADLHAKTVHEERAKEIALRYCQVECVDYLDWAESKQQLLAAIALMRDTMSDPEKVQGRLNREDKSLVTSLCNEKEQWVGATQDATTSDFIEQTTTLGEGLAPIWQKLSEPVPEKPEKK